MPRGGPREGAGRKEGAASKKTRDIADKAAKSKITPLEVMLEAMHTAYSGGDLTEAAKHAAVAAPYVHPRLTDNKNTTRVIRGVEDLTDDELAALEGGSGEDEAGGGPDGPAGVH